MKSAFTFMVDFINSKEVGDEISRYQLQAEFRKEFQQTRNINSIDSYKSYFIKLGFLEQSKAKGYYKIAMKLPEDLTAISLRRMYNEATGYTEKRDLQFESEMSAAEFLKIKYKPVEFSIMNELTYVQGTMLVHLVNYAESKDNNDISAVIYYANVSNKLNHVCRTIHYSTAVVTRFCEINGLDIALTNIFKRVLQCNWVEVLKDCRTLIND